MKSILISIKLDEELKSQANSVLSELGLDLPTAIRMYMKAIERENGLPISTSLPKTPVAAPTRMAAPVSLDEGKTTLVKKVTVEEPVAPVGKILTADELFEEEPTEPISTPVEEPSEPTVVIDYDSRAGRKAIANLYINEICAVPEGSLTRWSDMEARLSAQYGTEVKRPASIRWPETTTTPDGEEISIPYWRIVGERGAVRGDKMIDIDLQKERLTAEGHEFAPAGHGIFTGIKVQDYKHKLI